MARADARTNEYLARRARGNAEGAAAVGPMAGGPSSSSAGRAVPAPPQGEQGGHAARVEPACAGGDPH
eukprot:8176925-Alexandrium_andersonii.AAC.1